MKRLVILSALATIVATIGGVLWAQQSPQHTQQR